ncbi:hypothetical protein Bca4012_029656 [Brassica carinata]|uniref:(rape) hypothetical protein n=1 Tax=Brassica napus TaxID=3708 RepID=A0A816JDQ2_BRANA|nr:unnamed protein product [Brassica napus]
MGRVPNGLPVKTTFVQLIFRDQETKEQSIIPGLPDDLALRCIAKLSHGYHGTLECVSKDRRDLVHSEASSCYKARNRWSERWLFAHSNNQ